MPYDTTHDQECDVEARSEDFGSLAEAFDAERARRGMGKLVICPTPLGNLGDMTQRAKEALASADCVCAEDTRVTGKLLAAFGLSNRLERLDEESIAARTHDVIGRIASGQTIAYCSDAGMPGVSDPGQRLVAAAYEAGVPVEVLPGPTAVSTGYVASGFLCPRFYFGGFFPRKDSERQAALKTVESLDAVSLFYESPHRICSALRAVEAMLPLRQVAVCRELTKLHEEVARGSAAQLAEMFEQRERDGALKGEIVFVIDAAGAEEQTDRERDALDSAHARAVRLLEEGTLSKKDIVRTLQREFGIARNAAYDMVHTR